MDYGHIDPSNGGSAIPYHQEHAAPLCCNRLDLQNQLAAEGHRTPLIFVPLFGKRGLEGAP
jgi:hypothetical protein